jgi:hypothetical protein
MALSGAEARDVPYASKQKDVTKLIVATSIGNALKWYDIAVYGCFAIYVSKAFFPNEDQTASLLLTLGTFGVSGAPDRRLCARRLCRSFRPQGVVADLHRHDDVW